MEEEIIIDLEVVREEVDKEEGDREEVDSEVAKRLWLDHIQI